MDPIEKRGYRAEYVASPGRALFELALFGGGFALFVRTNVRRGEFGEDLVRWTLGVAALYALAYGVAYRGMPKRWGLTWDGLGTGLLPSVWIVLLCLLPLSLPGILVVLGLEVPAFDLQPRAYLLWCLVQDFVFFSFFARHAETALRNGLLASLAAGAAFGLSHLPYRDFAWITAGAGSVWALIFLRTGCLYPVLLAHWALGLALLRP